MAAHACALAVAPCLHYAILFLSIHWPSLFGLLAAQPPRTLLRGAVAGAAKPAVVASYTTTAGGYGCGGLGGHRHGRHRVVDHRGSEDRGTHSSGGGR